MQLTLLIICIFLFVSNMVFIVLYTRKPKQIKQDNESIQILADLLKNRRVLVELRRVDPGQVFLRSPRDTQ